MSNERRRDPRRVRALAAMAIPHAAASGKCARGGATPPDVHISGNSEIVARSPPSVTPPLTRSPLSLARVVHIEAGHNTRQIFLNIQAVHCSDRCNVIADGSSQLAKFREEYIIVTIVVMGSKHSVGARAHTVKKLPTRCSDSPKVVSQLRIIFELTDFIRQELSDLLR